MNIAVIPARGGSKRIPGKNVREFCGKAIIAYSIEAAMRSGCFERVLVSTDDEKVAEVARGCGAEVPFTRPVELADDHTPTIPVIKHALDWVDEGRGRVEKVCCIYATAPFLRATDLQRSELLLEPGGGVDFVVSVTSFDFPIFRALKLDEGTGMVRMFWPEHNVTRSQDLPEAFHDAGQFYWGTPAAFRSAEGFFAGETRGFPLPRERVQDIDTPEDWVRAERLFEMLPKEA